MNETKTRLSKSILEMKFMKRTKEKVEKQQFQEEGEEYFDNELTVNMKKESGRFLIEPSYVSCEKLIDGRVSFQGMNPEIEKLMEMEEYGKIPKVEPKKEVDVSDEQMACTFKSFSKQAKTNHKHKNKDDDEPLRKRPKFLKPLD